jgi:protein-S-isoprenylcysteine O-methyltransferase Ste14
MIQLALALGTFAFYAIRWRPSVLKRVAKSDKSMPLLMCDLLLLLLVIYQLCGAKHLEFPAPPYINYFGLVAATFGATLATSARLALEHNYLPALSTAAPSSLTVSGPYRVVRHPCYSGSIIAFVGFETALTNYLVIVTLPLVFIVCRQIAKEESLLSDFHEAEWRRFIARTPYKLLPYIY